MNKRILLLLVAAFCGAILTAAPHPLEPQGRIQPPNVLSAEEKAQGWRLLFDGRTFAGWRGLGLDHVPAKHWVIEDGAIKKVPTTDVPLQADGQPLAGGDLITVETFRDFELRFEWENRPGGQQRGQVQRLGGDVLGPGPEPGRPRLRVPDPRR